MTILEKKKARLKNLSQYKGLSDAELTQIAKDKLEEEKKYKADWVGLTKEEAKTADNSYKSYIDKYSVEKFSELEDLKSLIVNEVIKERYQKHLLEKEEKNQIPPKTEIDAFTSIQNQILTLKDKLGFLEDVGKDDPFKYHQQLKKKFKRWCENNQVSRTLTCPYCSRLIMLLMRVDKYDALKHPYFKDKTLFNEHAFKLLEEGKISKLDVAKIIQGEEAESTDYVNLILDRIQPPSSSENDPIFTKDE